MSTKTDRIEVDRDLLEQLLANYESARKSSIHERSTDWDNDRAKLDREIGYWRRKLGMDPSCYVCGASIPGETCLSSHSPPKPRHRECCPDGEFPQHSINLSTLTLRPGVEDNIFNVACVKCGQKGTVALCLNKENVQW